MQLLCYGCIVLASSFCLRTPGGPPPGILLPPEKGHWLLPPSSLPRCMPSWNRGFFLLIWLTHSRTSPKMSVLGMKQKIPALCHWEKKSTGPGSRPPFGESPLGFAVAKFGLAGFKRRPCSGEQGEKKRAGHNCVLVFRYWISASKETTFLSIDHRVLGAFQWEELEFVCDEDWNLRYKGSLVYLGFWTHRNLLFQRKINGKFKKRFHIKHDFCLLGFLESILAKYIFMSHQVTFVSNHTWTTEEKRLKKGYAILGTSPGLTKKNNPAFG